MKQHRLTGTDLRVSAFCLGAGGWGTALCGAALERLYDLFREAGGNFFDTAHCYGFWVKGGLGASERALGECVRRSGDRARVVIATKGGHPAVPPDYPRSDRYLGPRRIAADVQESLDRLGVDQIDVYYLHRDDPRLPVGEIIETLNAEVRRGRVRCLGASNWTTARIGAANAYARAHRLQGFAVSEPQWNLAQPNLSDPTLRFVTAEDARWYARHRVAVVPYSPTACGYFARVGDLAGKPFDNAVSRARLERARELARRRRVTPNQVALAWLLGQRFPVIPILGTTQPAHLRDALGAARLELTAEEMRWLCVEEV